MTSPLGVSIVTPVPDSGPAGTPIYSSRDPAGNLIGTSRYKLTSKRAGP